MATTHTFGEATMLLGGLYNDAPANMNSTADQAIAINLRGARAYVIDRIVATNASTSLSLAAGGLYSGTSKGGSAIVAAAQVFSGLTAASKTIAPAIAVTDRRTETTLYLSLTVAQGGAATMDYYIFGHLLP